MKEIYQDFILSASERKLAAAMVEDGYLLGEIARTIASVRLIPKTPLLAGRTEFVGPDKLSERISPIDARRLKLTRQGAMLTFWMPSGLTIESLEGSIRSLQVWAGHRPLEIRSHFGYPALVSVLFVLRDCSARTALNSRVGNFLSNLAASDFVIFSPQRYPQYRISGPDDAKKGSVVEAMRTSLQFDTRPWGFWRVYKSGAVWGETGRRTFGTRVVANDRLPEKLLHWLHDEMLQRLDYLKHYGAEQLAELPNYASLDPHLLVIEDINALLDPSALEDLDVEESLMCVATRRAILEDLGRNPQVDIHVIVGKEAPYFDDSQNISLRETLLVLGIGSSRYSTSVSNPRKALTSDSCLDRLRRFVTPWRQFFAQFCLPIMVPRAMKEVRNDDASPNQK